MTQLSANFKRSEFACGCGCGFDDIDLKAVDICQKVRDHFQQPVHVTSACRCPKHNAAVGGSSGSKHLEAIAVDLVVENVHAHDVYDYLDVYSAELGVGGLGRYDGFTHVDVRPFRARW